MPETGVIVCKHKLFARRGARRPNKTIRFEIAFDLDVERKCGAFCYLQKMPSANRFRQASEMEWTGRGMDQEWTGMTGMDLKEDRRV